MNYRHAFHAGNFADVMKHALLARILTHLNAKPAPWRCIDIHAGAGLYDLSADQATRTGEWQGGIGLMQEPLEASAEALLAPWRQVVSAIRMSHGEAFYPGSPLIALRLARGADVILANERHAETAQHLRGAMARDGRSKLVELDGSVALRANIPPPEKRGLVLIDPPFERADEFAVMAKDVIAAHAKWPTGIYALWYPLKDMALVEGLVSRLDEAGLARILRLELTIHHKPTGLGGCGLIIINPPWRLREEAEILLPALAARLALGVDLADRRPGWRCDAIWPDGR
jgi:23S rRNA (adenine2030-N6)-methyltransferase